MEMESTLSSTKSISHFYFYFDFNFLENTLEAEVILKLQWRFCLLWNPKQKPELKVLFKIKESNNTGTHILTYLMEGCMHNGDDDYVTKSK
jgi:hypothetical protein